MASDMRVETLDEKTVKNLECCMLLYERMVVPISEETSCQSLFLSFNWIFFILLVSDWDLYYLMIRRSKIHYFFLLLIDWYLCSCQCFYPNCKPWHNQTWKHSLRGLSAKLVGTYFWAVFFVIRIYIRRWCFTWLLLSETTVLLFFRASYGVWNCAVNWKTRHTAIQ